jgi:asparagine synthase (glutamine-hydrolysing)
MCGFIALMGLRGQTPPLEALNRAKLSLVHRGPDGEGSYCFENVALGFRRLAILDLESTGSQPMVYEDGSLAIVFNGAIFNFIELRTELQALGYQFRSTGDTEVLLTAYRQWGRDCLARLNGMWAFVIVDKRKREIFGARDRFGEKPLFVSRTNKWLLFGSEIKALREARLVDLHVNWPIVSEWVLEDRLDHSDETFYKEVTRVPAGSAFTVSLDSNSADSLVFYKYWNIDNDIATPGANPVEEFAELFESAVRIRTRSDVPVGVMLSGGVDSTAVACAMHRAQSDQSPSSSNLLDAFCFRDPVYNEDQYISATNDRCGLRIHTFNATVQDLWRALPEHLSFHDEPVHSVASLIGFELMRTAKQHGVPVILGGQGADETLAGYYSYYRELWQGLFNSGKIPSLLQSMSAYRREHQMSFLHELTSLMKFAVIRKSLPIHDHVQRAKRNRLYRLKQSKLFTGPIIDSIRAREYPIAGDGLRQVLRRSVEVSELPLYLRVEDRNAMAHSVEARLPFMDYRLVSFADKVSDDIKLKAPWNKWLLRESMKGKIPELVRTRASKYGFSVSMDSWFHGPLQQPMRDLIYEERHQLKGLVDLPSVEAALANGSGMKMKGSWANHFFTVAQLAIWLANCRKYGVSL